MCSLDASLWANVFGFLPDGDARVAAQQHNAQQHPPRDHEPQLPLWYVQEAWHAAGNNQDRLVESALRHGQLDVLEWLLHHCDWHPEAQHCCKLARHGHLATLQWAHQHGGLCDH